MSFDYYLAVGGIAHGKLLDKYGHVTRVARPVELPVSFEEIPFDCESSRISFDEYELRPFTFKGRRMQYFVLRSLDNCEAVELIMQLEDEEEGEQQRA